MLFRHVLDLGDDAGAVGLPVLDGFFDQAHRGSSYGMSSRTRKA